MQQLLNISNCCIHFPPIVLQAANGDDVNFVFSLVGIINQKFLLFGDLGRFCSVIWEIDVLVCCALGRKSVGQYA